MNIIGWAREILKIFGENKGVSIIFENNRVYLPYAVLSPTYKLIGIYGNVPSLVRLGLCHLIGHELAHLKHYELYGNTGDDYSSSFIHMENEETRKIWKRCLEEHD